MTDQPHSYCSCNSVSPLHLQLTTILLFRGIISNPSHHETNDISTFGDFLGVAASAGISLPPQGSRHVVILATGRNRLARGFQAVVNFCCAIAQWTCGTILTIYWRHGSGRAISLRNEQKTMTPPILPDSRQRRQFDFCNIGQNTMFAKGTAYMWLPKPSTSLPVYRTMPMKRSILNFDLNHFMFLKSPIPTDDPHLTSMPIVLYNNFSANRK